MDEDIEEDILVIKIYTVSDFSTLKKAWTINVNEDDEIKLTELIEYDES